MSQKNLKSFVGQIYRLCSCSCSWWSGRIATKIKQCLLKFHVEGVCKFFALMLCILNSVFTHIKLFFGGLKIAACLVRLVSLYPPGKIISVCKLSVANGLSSSKLVRGDHFTSHFLLSVRNFVVSFQQMFLCQSSLWLGGGLNDGV